jgi:5-methylcytosine-specific restriction endonuclease McrA
MSTEKSDKCWYTRRGGVMRGPFTAENISRYILLGRIDLDDELSQDRETWIVAGHLDSLLPAELKSQSSWDDYQKLVTAHMQADERKADRRTGKRKHYLDRHAEKRIKGDRRSHVDNTLLCQHLLDKPVTSDEKRPVSGHKRPVVLFVVLLLTMMFAWLSPIQS